MDVLIARQSAEFLNPCLHIVARNGFPFLDGFQIHLFLYRFIGLNRALRDVQAEIPLRPQDCEPIVPLEQYPALRTPNTAHCG